MNYVFIAAFAAFSAVHLYASWRCDKLLRAVTKVFLLPTLLGWYLTTAQAPLDIVVAAVVTSWLGDVLLIFGPVGFVFRGLVGNVKPRSLYVGMMGYLVVNGAMNCFALFQLITLPCLATAIMYAGAVSFFVSDSILFYVRFRKGRPFKTHFGVMLTYLLAEFLIVAGFILLTA